MTKTIEPSGNVMLISFDNLRYEHKMVLSAEDASALLAILGRAGTLTEKYKQDAIYTSGLPEQAVLLTSYPTDKLNDLKKAAFLGIPYSQYMEGKDAKSGADTGEEPV